MKLLILNTNDPYYNLAVEEYIFDKCVEETFILWQNEPCVVLGKNQNAFAEIDIDYAKQKNIKIVRRITGGGTVYHDLGNLNFSYISPNHDGGINFEKFTYPIVDALLSLSLNAELSGRNDILIDGKKVSGNAQFARGSRVLHHGTILFDSDLTVLSSVLRVDPSKINAKAIKSVRTRVTNVKDELKNDISISEFRSIIAERLKKMLGAEECEAPISNKIKLLYERNSSKEWIFPERGYLSKYSLIFKKRFAFGSLEFLFSMKNETVESLSILGDFFEIRPVSELEVMFKGKTLKEIINNNKVFKVENYIYGMTSDDLIELFENKVLPENNI